MIRQFKKQLKLILDPISKMHFQSVPEKAMYPHIVVDFPNTIVQEGFYQMTMDIDIWDKGESTANVDRLTSEISEALDRYHYIDENFKFTIWLTTILSVGSEDQTLKRTTCVFEVHLRSSK